MVGAAYSDLWVTRRRDGGPHPNVGQLLSAGELAILSDRRQPSPRVVDKELTAEGCQNSYETIQVDVGRHMKEKKHVTTMWTTYNSGKRLLKCIPANERGQIRSKFVEGPIGLHQGLVEGAMKTWGYT